MEIRIRKLKEEEGEYLEIGCHKVDENVNEIIRFAKLRQGSLEAFRDEKLYQIALSDIYYIEAVDERCFIYLEKECYESKKRLYEFEELLSSRNYIRISKSMVVNMMKITVIKPALNGRFLCRLKNGESVIISRKYVPDVKERLKNG